MPLNHVYQQHIIWRTRLETCEERLEAFHGRVGGETVGGGHGHDDEESRVEERS